MCPHTIIYAARSAWRDSKVQRSLCVLILLHICPHSTIYVSSYYYIYVLILVYMPHAARGVTQKYKCRPAGADECFCGYFGFSGATIFMCRGPLYMCPPLCMCQGPLCVRGHYMCVRGHYICVRGHYICVRGHYICVILYICVRCHYVSGATICVRGHYMCVLLYMCVRGHYICVRGHYVCQGPLYVCPPLYICQGPLYMCPPLYVSSYYYTSMCRHTTILSSHYYTTICVSSYYYNTRYVSSCCYTCQGTFATQSSATSMLRHSLSRALIEP